MSAAVCRPSYSIFVRFRKSRLVLRRGIVRYEDALALAEELRQNRFHNQDAVFVVKEPEGTIVDGGPRSGLASDELPEAPEPGDGDPRQTPGGERRG